MDDDAVGGGLKISLLFYDLNTTVLNTNQNILGHLSYGFGSFIPLKALYDLYRTLGEPHTVRKFICSVRRLPYDTDFPPVNLIDAPEDISPGYNAYIFGDQISYVMG